MLCSSAVTFSCLLSVVGLEGCQRSVLGTLFATCHPRVWLHTVLLGCVPHSFIGHVCGVCVVLPIVRLFCSGVRLRSLVCVPSLLLCSNGDVDLWVARCDSSILPASLVLPPCLAPFLSACLFSRDPCRCFSRTVLRALYHCVTLSPCSVRRYSLVFVPDRLVSRVILVTFSLVATRCRSSILVWQCATRHFEVCGPLGFHGRNP